MIAPHLWMFKRPVMLTLTVDPKNFVGGREAYGHVMGQGLIRRLIRLMGVRKAWAWLEFHKSKDSRPDGNEWPHWHIVIDLADLPGGWVDYKRVWRLVRDTWKVGGFHAGGDGRRAGRKCSAYQASKYALQYAKRKNPAAEWVLSSGRLPRAFEVYGELRAAVRAARRAERGEWATDAERAESVAVVESAAEVDEPADSTGATDLVGESGRRRSWSTVRERREHCGHGVELVRETVYSGGSVVHRYVGHVAGLTPDHVRWAGKRSLLRGVDVERETLRRVVYGPHGSGLGEFEVERLVVDLASYASVDDAVSELRREAFAESINRVILHPWESEGAASLAEEIRAAHEARWAEDDEGDAVVDEADGVDCAGVLRDSLVAAARVMFDAERVVVELAENVSRAVRVGESGVRFSLRGPGVGGVGGRVRSAPASRQSAGPLCGPAASRAHVSGGG